MAPSGARRAAARVGGGRPTRDLCALSVAAPRGVCLWLSVIAHLLLVVCVDCVVRAV